MKRLPPIAPPAAPRTAKAAPTAAVARPVAARPRPPGSEVGFAAATAPAIDSRPRAPWSARSQQAAAAIVAQAKREPTFEGQVKVALQQLLALPELKGAKASVTIADLKSNAPALATNDSQRLLNPASNSKLATASFALATLGPRHRFETRLSTDAHGNLYLKGGFDPSLTTESLDAIAHELASKGVRQVADLVLDNSALTGSRVPQHFNEAGDADWDYLARPEALSVDKNLVEVTVAPGARAGAPAKATADEHAFELRSTVATTAAAQPFRVGVDEEDQQGVLTRNAKGQAIIDVTGTIAADYTKARVLKMKSPDNVALFADQLRAALVRAGIQVGGQAREGAAPADAKQVLTHQSQPLGELLKTSLAESNAFDHEMYALAASAHLSPDGTTSLAQAVDRLNGYLDGVGVGDATFSNASGIGRANQLSADDVVKLLRRASADPQLRPLLDGLARPGMAKSTLMTRMVGTSAEGRLRAKTGTLTGVVAMSGVVQSPSGREVAFSSILNGLPAGATGREAGRTVVDTLGIVLSSL